MSDYSCPFSGWLPLFDHQWWRLTAPIPPSHWTANPAQRPPSCHAPSSIAGECHGLRCWRRQRRPPTVTGVAAASTVPLPISHKSTALWQWSLGTRRTEFRNNINAHAFIYIYTYIIYNRCLNDLETCVLITSSYLESNFIARTQLQLNDIECTYIWYVWVLWWFNGI